MSSPPLPLLQLLLPPRSFSPGPPVPLLPSGRLGRPHRVAARPSSGMSVPSGRPPPRVAPPPRPPPRATPAVGLQEGAEGVWGSNQVWAGDVALGLGPQPAVALPSPLLLSLLQLVLRLLSPSLPSHYSHPAVALAGPESDQRSRLAPARPTQAALPAALCRPGQSLPSHVLLACGAPAAEPVHLAPPGRLVALHAAVLSALLRALGWLGGAAALFAHAL